MRASTKTEQEKNNNKDAIHTKIKTIKAWAKINHELSLNYGPISLMDEPPEEYEIFIEIFYKEYQELSNINALLANDLFLFQKLKYIYTLLELFILKKMKQELLDDDI